MKNILPMACLLFGVGAAGRVLADELIVNGGFETGSMTPWTVTGPFIAMQSGTGHTGSYYVYCGAGMNDNGTVGDEFSQTVTTVPGASYDLSVWVNGSVNGGAGEVYMQWNNTRVIDASDPNYNGWTELSVTAPATSTQTTFSFGSRNDPSAYYFDDASVMPSAAPEPPASALTGLGVVGLMVLRRFRKV